MARKKTLVKSETKIKASRVYTFTGMIILASMVISAFLTAVFTK